jgi:hypothetical protein
VPFRSSLPRSPDITLLSWLQVVRRIDPQIRAAIRATVLSYVGRAGAAATIALPSEEEQIVPTRLNLVTIYIPGTAEGRLIYWANHEQGYSELT